MAVVLLAATGGLVRMHLQRRIAGLPWMAALLGSNGIAVAAQAADLAVVGPAEWTAVVVTAAFSAGMIVALRQDFIRLRAVAGEHEARLAAQAAESAQAVADMERFAYAASHDLQEPLRTINATTQILTDRVGAQLRPEDQQLLVRLERACVRMQVLIQGLLEFSRTGRNLEKQRFNLECSVIDARNACAARLRETGTTLTVGDLPEVYGSQAALESVFRNLITNAIKYGRPGVVPAILIDAEWEEGERVISVADNGRGIPGDRLGEVWEAFARVAADVKGTGLGLAMVRRIVLAHGGRCWIESREGVGTRVRFTLGDR